MQITVSELIVKFLERLDIECIFGMPGAHILPVYDSLYDSPIKTILAKHEQGASFMAGGYARASGKIGACITTAGPGATNLVTGIANAYADKQPILIITGETSTHIFGKGGLQESSGEGGSIDQVELFKGITQYNRIIERTDYLQNVLNKAAKILLSETPGPVLLSFPFNVQKEMVDERILDNIKTTPFDFCVGQVSSPLDECYRLLAEAKKPVILAGYGCIQSGAQQILGQLSEQLNIPVTSSLKGKGSISENSHLSLGSLGVTSYSDALQYILHQADLLIFLGASFNERTSYVWNQDLLKNKKIIQVDNDFEQLEKVFTADVAIQGDIKNVLEALSEQIGQKNIPAKNYMPLSSENNERDKSSGIFHKNFALIENVFKHISQAIDVPVQVFDDNIIFAQNFYQVSVDDRYYPNSGVSSLGHAIPAAIGARFVDDRPAFAIIGDGGFQMCCMEIMTAVNYNIPLNIILFNNSTMGLIRKNQFQQYDERFINCDFINPDYELLAKSFDIEYQRVETEADLSAAFKACDFTGAINLIEVMIDKNAFPNYVSKR